MIAVHKRPAAYSLLAALMTAAIVGRDCVRSDTLPRKVKINARKVKINVCASFAYNNLHPEKMYGILILIG